MTIHHFLNCYGPDEKLTFSVPLPVSHMDIVKKMAGVDPADTDALGCYPLTDSQAQAIAAKFAPSALKLLHGMAVFLEPMVAEAQSEGTPVPVPVPG